MQDIIAYTKSLAMSHMAICTFIKYSFGVIVLYMVYILDTLILHLKAIFSETLFPKPNSFTFHSKYALKYYLNLKM